MNLACLLWNEEVDDLLLDGDAELAYGVFISRPSTPTMAWAASKT